MDKITYTCKCCGWMTEVPGEWTDMSPRFCGNSSCELSLKKSKGKKSFKSNPDQLIKQLPEVIEESKKLKIKLKK